ncbi:MAG TPA: ABC transporter permease subunit [bacterium]|nr:ABC transporter permease subunit [bacterium]
MSREFKDMRLIAGHDYRDSFRSRRMLVWMILYLCVAVGSTFIFCQVLRAVEREIAKVAAVETGEKAGGVTESLQKSKAFREIVNNLIEEPELADQLLSLPPLVLFYAWFSFTFMPLLVIILCSDTIARDIQTRYVRFNLFRTSRAAYVTGKSVSAASLLLAALLVSGLASMVVGAFRLHPFDFFAVLPHILFFVVKCWVFMLAFLGIALMASQLRSSPLQAQILGLLTYFFLMILGPIARMKAGPGLARLWELGNLISPGPKVAGLWMPDIASNLKAAAFSAGLGLFYFAIGFLVFSRRDL